MTLKESALERARKLKKLVRSESEKGETFGVEEEEDLEEEEAWTIEVVCCVADGEVLGATEESDERRGAKRLERRGADLSDSEIEWEVDGL